MKAFILAALLTTLLTSLTPPQASAAEMTDMSDPLFLTSSAVELRVNLRKLWEEHITYTRNFIISDLANLGDKSHITERLLKNQADIGDAFKPIYGTDAGNKLTILLKEHIVIAARVVDAAKKKQNVPLKKATDEWNKNGEEIATFLSGANPYWKKSEMVGMLAKHLSLTTSEVNSRLNKNWVSDTAAYDEGHEHMLMFSDELTKGIVKQFPEKFKSKNMVTSNEKN